MAGDKMEDVEQEAKGPVGKEVIRCELFDEALELEDSKPDKAVKLFQKVVWLEDERSQMHKIKEKAIFRMATIYAQQGQAKELRGLLLYLQPLFDRITKAKTAKIVKEVIEIIGKECGDDMDLQVGICESAIKWCKKEKRTFLKQRIQLKLAAFQLETHQYKSALALTARLVRDVKKFDDKRLLVEIELLASKIHSRLQNLPKAKGSLTAARSNANAVYILPGLQAQIDLQAGTLCGVEKDHKTAFSYFYEAYEGYNTMGDAKMAVLCLKYMLLTKIMTNSTDDVYSIVNGKAGVKYAGIEVEAMKAVADAYKKRSVDDFEEVFDKYKEQLAGDPVVLEHLDELRGSLLEQNLLRLIEPFSRVQIAHVAKLIKLPVDNVISKLSEMILDKKVAGILDQGSGDLILFDEEEEDKVYVASLDVLKELGGVVDRLHTKAGKI
jgi:26S proteasome regulatory subunit N6